MRIRSFIPLSVATVALLSWFSHAAFRHSLAGVHAAPPSQTTEQVRYVIQALKSVHGRELEILELIVNDPGWSGEQPWDRALIAALTESLAKRENRGDLVRLLDQASQTGRLPWKRLAILEGVARVVAEGAQIEPEALRKFQAGDDEMVKRRAAQILEDLKHLAERTAKVPDRPAAALNPEEQQLFEQGRFNFDAVCAGCHLESGKGMSGFAPPLVNSRWVLGPEKFLAMIVLQGKEGSPDYPPMPPLRGLDDKRIASILTYIRRQWGHQAGPVKVETVEEVRRITADRAQAWRERELEELLKKSPPP